MALFRRGCGCVVVLAALAIAPAARAQGVDLRVETASPSAVEYQLPLERVRQAAQPGGPPAKVRPGARTAPAFGEGIRPPATSATAPQDQGVEASRASTRSGAKKRASHDGGMRAAVAVEPQAAPLPPPAFVKAAGGPGSSMFGVGAIAAAVLALGAGIGLLLRRVREQ